jgi:tetratricopeptide (TPR) repeat protein
MKTDWTGRLARASRHPLFWILLAATALRLAFWLQVRHEPTFTVPLWDEAVFDGMARSIAHGHGIGSDKAYFFGPLYAYTLGLVYAVTGSSAAIAIVLQHLLGLVLAGLTYKLARQWFDRCTALVAAAILAFSGLQVFFEGKLLMEVLVSTLLAGGLLLLAGAATKPGRWRLFGAGLLLGLAATGRPTLLLLAPLALIPLLRAAPRPPKRILAIFAAALLLAPTATFIRNLAVERAPVFITSSGGYNFYAGNAHDDAARAQLDTDSSWNAEDTAEVALGRDLNSAEVSRYWQGRANEVFRRDPAGWLGRYLGKLDLFLGGQDKPQIEWFGYEHQRWSVLRWGTLGLWPLMALAVAGMLAMARRWKDLGLLYGVVLLTALGVALFFVTTRYRVALLPYLSVFAAAYVIAFARATRARAWRTVGILALVAMAATAYTAPARRPLDRQAALYAQYLHEGLQLTRAGRVDAAIATYGRARDLRPDDFEGHLSLGVAWREKGDFERSLAALQAALPLAPQDPDVPYQLAVTLHAMNRFPEAEQAAQASLRLGPRRGATLTTLGLIHAAEGRYPEARAEIERGLALDPAQPQALNNLGALLGIQGDAAGARRSFEQALRIDDGFAPARINLARSYLEAGDQKAAAAELRRVLEDDPANAAATQLLREIGGR